ncbi:MAG: hypothetical protein IK997_01485 [Bacilli bacterium]|nr:hypothetical protein [Bacilli bacterium]
MDNMEIINKLVSKQIIMQNDIIEKAKKKNQDKEEELKSMLSKEEIEDNIKESYVDKKI